ncbi:PEP-CTERM sorting domain-containing protein [Myxacorys almedinensis]|uniref:PEP-CTERM sorting domain-containing protein n=1 Tax=Myxacorys almedinensis A TaxID=2690445 RepID=A0A8J7YZD5_9CYAN|nr:PEP-CTERM sorting domain-containing protein [Myxacorys almedinensis]NDJ16854.1 PEP-CTERM sorting domain-containing protein [Myxacorys almedinensis A]
MKERSLPKVYLLTAVFSCVSGITASAHAGTLASLGVQHATPYDEYVQSVARQKESHSSTEEFSPQHLLQADISPLLVVQQTLSSEAPRVNSLREARLNDEVIIKSEVPPAPERVEIPEPSVVLGLVTTAAIFTLTRRRRFYQQKND